MTQSEGWLSFFVRRILALRTCEVVLAVVVLRRARRRGCRGTSMFMVLAGAADCRVYEPKSASYDIFVSLPLMLAPRYGCSTYNRKHPMQAQDTSQPMTISPPSSSCHGDRNSRPNLAALLRDDCEADLVIVKSHPGNIANRCQRSYESYGPWSAIACMIASQAPSMCCRSDNDRVLTTEGRGRLQSSPKTHLAQWRELLMIL